MSSPLDELEETESVFDLNEVIPETELLDNSIQKGRAQLSVKARRNRPSRSRFRDSVSSSEGDDGLERKESPLHSARSPLHSNTQGSSPSPDSLLSSRSPAFSFDTSLVRRPQEDGGTGLAAPRGRYRQLTNASSQEALVTTPTSSPSRSCPGSNSSPLYARRNHQPDSEVLVSDYSRDPSPADPGSPTTNFDKKTKRRFMDLGVTLRRSYVRVRKEKSNRLSMGSRDPSESPSRSSGSFVSFSWFTEGRASGTPPSSPKLPPLGHSTPPRSHSQESALSEDFSPRSSTPPPADSSSRSSHPYHTLSQSSDEPHDEPRCLVSLWSRQQVCDWLRGLHMEQYVTHFSSRDIDGEQLLQLDGARLKALGVSSSWDRGVLKRRIKELHAATERERKAQEKQERQRDKQRRKDNLEQRRS